MTVAGQSRVMDRWAEGILQTLVEIAPEIRKNQHDYDLMADFMLSATMGLNGFIAMGVAQDWATHMIGHELTALHGLTHGATLAIVLPGTLREQRTGAVGDIALHSVDGNEHREVGHMSRVCFHILANVANFR